MRPPHAVVLLAPLILGVSAPAEHGVDRDALSRFVEAYHPDLASWPKDTPTVEARLYEACRDRPRSCDASGAVAKELGIPLDLAAQVVDALTWSNRSDEREADGLRESMEAVAARWLPVLEEASRKAVFPMPAIRSTLDFHARWDARSPNGSARLVRWLATLPDPAAAAIEVAASEDYRLRSTSGPAALAAGLAARPGHPALLLALAQTVDDPAERIAFSEAALRALEPSEAGAPERVSALFAQAALAALLDAGLAEPALDAIASWPEARRTAALRSTAGEVAAVLRGLRVEGELRDLSPDLAAAAALAGDAAASDRWGASEAPRGAKAADDAGKRDGLRSRLLDRYLHPTGDDPFDLLVDVLLSHQTLPSIDPIPNGTWRRLLAALAERERYAGVASAVAREVVAELRGGRTSARLPYSAMPDALVASARAAADRVLSLADATESRFVFGGEAAAAAGDAVPSRIDRLLAAPRMGAFAERPLPAATAPAELSDEAAGARAAVQAQELGVPGAFEFVRVERNGAQVVAVGLSQDLDPVGELSRGAYWIVRSTDGGATWRPPLYTGLRVTMPYVVPSASRLPMIAENGLRLEVAVEELDASTITFPPIGTRVKREQRGLYLEIPWADLERDSDGDGLTDLVEERVVTDPHDRDTDGDGIDDGHDAAPQVPLGASSDPRASLLQAFLSNLAGRPTGAIIHEAGTADPSDLEELLGKAKRASITESGTMFVVGDREVFRAFLPEGRLVVLSPEEHAAAEKKFGPIYATRISLLIVDRSGRRGYLVWDAAWTGGTMRFEKKGEVWVVEVASSWIT